jgi:hypothetical protein
MYAIKPTNSATWTAKIMQAALPFSPLCATGPVCLCLDAEVLLYDFYVVSGLRQTIKRFCMTHRWQGNVLNVRSGGENGHNAG